MLGARDRGGPRWPRWSPRATTPCCGPATPTWPSRSTPTMPTPAYLPGFDLPAELVATADFEEAVCAADLLVIGVPTSGFRAVLEEAAPCMRPWIPVVSLSKGLEKGTLLRMTEVIKEVVPGPPGGRPDRAQPRPRDHVGQGRRLGHRHRGPRGGQGHPGGVHPGRVPGLLERRRRRLRDGWCVEERHRHRRRDRRGAGGGRQHPGRGDVPRPGRADPAGRCPGCPADHVRGAWPGWAT